MPLPVKKLTHSKAGKRRSHHALKKINLGICSKCGRDVRPHTACSFCGNYKGKEAVKIKAKKVKNKK